MRTAVQPRHPDDPDGFREDFPQRVIEAQELAFAGGGRANRLTTTVKSGRMTDPIAARLLRVI